MRQLLRATQCLSRAIARVSAVWQEKPQAVAVLDDEISPFDLQRVHEVARAVAHPPDRELLHAIPRDYTVDQHGGIQSVESARFAQNIADAIGAVGEERNSVGKG